MGLFSSIGDFLGTAAKAVLPAVGTFFGGPVGGALGSAAGGILGSLDQNIGPIIGGAAQYFSAQDVANQNKENLQTQQGFNVTNAATANAFTERMLGTQYDRTQSLNREQFDRNSALQAAQFAENRYLTDQAIGENRATVDKALDYDTRMSNTSWQRGIADMKAAGINPMLAVSQGGASTPNAPVTSAPTGSAGGASVSSGSVGSGSGAMANASVLPGIDKIGSALNTAVSLRRADQDLKIAKAQEQLITEQQFETKDRATLYRQQANKTESEDRVVRVEEDLKKREYEDVHRYGTAPLGRNLGGLERIIETLWNRLRGNE